MAVNVEYIHISLLLFTLSSMVFIPYAYANGMYYILSFQIVGLLINSIGVYRNWANF